MKNKENISNVKIIENSVSNKSNVMEDCLTKKEKKNEFAPKFGVGDRVVYRNHFKEYIRWIPAIIQKIISSLTYLININDHIRYVHVNQLKLFIPRTNCEEFPKASFNEGRDNVVQSPNSSSSSSSDYSDCVEEPVDVQLRRSEREVRAPKRFTFSDFD